MIIRKGDLRLFVYGQDVTPYYLDKKKYRVVRYSANRYNRVSPYRLGLKHCVRCQKLNEYFDTRLADCPLCGKRLRARLIGR